MFAELEQNGVVVVRPESDGLDAISAERAPWETAERIFGARLELVERQPIAPVAWGKSFASTAVETPLHTDSQLYRGLPPHAQLMFCARAAERGGETRLVDTHALLERLERDDPELFGWLFERRRRIPFLFGDVETTTVSIRDGCFVFTHSPRPLPDDEVAARLGRHLANVEPIVVRVADGELMIVDNHRMLHGRAAFSGEERRFTRLLVWTTEPIGARPRFASLAKNVPVRSVDPEAAKRRRAVIDMLRGVPPGVLAARLGAPERLLYLWRDRALLAIDRTLEGDDQGQP